MKSKELPPDFQLESIVLVESVFKRVPDVNYGSPDIRINVRFDVGYNVDKDLISVLEEVKYSQNYKSRDEVNSTIVMCGVFKKTGETELEVLEEFARVTGAAIIFQHIREHLMDLSSKAGLDLIILSRPDFQ